MSETVYAAFADVNHAESAAGALLDHGIAASDISLVLNEKARKQVEGFTDSAAMGSQPTIVSGPAGSTGSFDPLGNDLRAGAGTPPIPGGNMFPLGQTAEVNADLNPALDDYPRGGADEATELSSRPPYSKSDWNPELDKRSYNADYDLGVHDKVDEEIRLDAERDHASIDPVNQPPVTTTAIGRGHDADVREYDADRAAKAGVSTTTIQDAAKGAAKGVGYGLGIGALAAVASIAIPGFGLVVGGGALAVAVAGLAATAGAGAVAGGVVGYLKDQGVPADEIPHYQQAYEDGGAILSVVIQDPLKAAIVQDLLRKYGASNVRPFGYAA
jgi:hypothetical protein